MKKIFTMIVFLLLLWSQAIAQGFSEIVLKTKHNTPLKVIIDGQLVSTNSPLVDIKNVPSGYHSLKVFRPVNLYYGYNEEALFMGNIFLPENTITKALVKNHKIMIVEQTALIPEPQNVVYNYMPNHNAYVPPAYGCNNPPHTICQIQEPVYEEPVVEPFPMSDKDFADLKNAINNEWFSDGKLIVFKQAVNAGNLFTSNQVAELIGLYDFSSEQIKVAKLAYKNTLDKEKYYKVFNALQWTSAKQELNNYIASL